jgi:hypothetical protein
MKSIDESLPRLAEIEGTDSGIWQDFASGIWRPGGAQGVTRLTFRVLSAFRG